MNYLIQKYNVPGPRYTSYPTVPFWDTSTYNEERWLDTVRRSFDESADGEGLSIYIHLPFCESLCTFCGCNKRITKNHAVESDYIDALLKEWTMYLTKFSSRPVIKEIHLGGGTPTFFSSGNLIKLIQGLFLFADRHPDWEFSFEAHPNNTTDEHLQALYDLGFRRVSFGIQDYDSKVQQAIHRVQPFSNVEKVHNAAKRMGYTSIGHDLIYGLPFQTEESIEQTIALTNQLRPDRIAFYSYAHVPWIKGNGQRGFHDSDLPKEAEKLKLYLTGKELLKNSGYKEIGMDHFALSTDSLCISAGNGLLHRNFMGYTHSKTRLLLGLGVSSISDSWLGFSQNVKTIEEYYSAINNNRLPLLRGHILTNQDLIIRQHILNLMCKLETSWEEKEMQFENLHDTLERLKEYESDQLVEMSENRLQLTHKGLPFMRNVCMTFDRRLLANEPDTPMFSMTI